MNICTIFLLQIMNICTFYFWQIIIAMSVIYWFKSHSGGMRSGLIDLKQGDTFTIDIKSLTWVNFYLSMDG